MKKFIPGLCSVSFRKNSPEEIITAMHDAGLMHIEWSSDVHAPCTDKDKLKNIANLQKHYDIECSSYGTYFRIGENKAEELNNYIHAADILGTKLLRLWCGTKGSASYETEEKKLLFENCRSIAKIAEESGITVAMECHQWTYTDTAESIAELIIETGSPNFCMYWQPNQYCSAEDNIRHIKMTEKYVTAIHAFNWERDKRFPLSDAVDTWTKYLSYIDGEHHLLLEFMPDDSIKSLRREANSLRTIIDKIK